ncbi:MAG: (Fe-S)-binding protein [Proteobacteria bacterium]|nr:(Fe-S)-binding protein [Pseudomonadota bacterium]
MALPRVGLFVTCLVDLFRPVVGFAAIKLLEEAGCRVEVPARQTCCGQPAYNSGDRRDAREIAQGVIDAFAGFDYVVVPSGSCAGMIKEHYPKLFEAEPQHQGAAERLAGRSFELVSFLVDVLKCERVERHHQAVATYHDSCSGLRELGVKRQPRRLLESVEGLRLKELPGAEICCGFGGTFCVKYPEISQRMALEKARDVIHTGADTLLAGDMGCLMNMAGTLKREGSAIAVRHVAEVLAGMTEEPAIADGLARRPRRR